jgi:hypothetical protein
MADRRPLGRGRGRRQGRSGGRPACRRPRRSLRPGGGARAAGRGCRRSRGRRLKRHWNHGSCLRFKVVSGWVVGACMIGPLRVDSMPRTLRPASCVSPALAPMGRESAGSSSCRNSRLEGAAAQGPEIDASPQKSASADRGRSRGPDLLSRPDRLNGPGAERSSGWQREGQKRQER